MKISIKEFNEFVSPLAGMKVSLTWKGYGSALFLELGELQPLEYPSQNYCSGEACISPGFEWRIEKTKRIICGSSNSLPNIEKGIKFVQGLIVKAIQLGGKLPELIISFSDGYRLRTMSMTSGEPMWGIRCKDGKRLSFDKGSLVQTWGNEPPDELSPEEKEERQLAANAEVRWKVPKSDPLYGDCTNCKYFVGLDGDSSLLDYGVCISDMSQFDGRVVYVLSGCPEFLSRLSKK